MLPTSLRSAFAGLLLVAAAGAIHAAQSNGAPGKGLKSTDGTATCRESSAQPAACFVSWAWRTTPRTYGWIQQFDPAARRWRSLAVVQATQAGASQDTVEDGFLYRVLGCDDLSGVSRCSTTSVFWAPYRPATVNEIPEVVVDRYGGRQLVAKNIPYEAQIAEYNVYQLMVQLDGLDRSVLPSMTEPRAESVSDWSVWDTVAYNIHNVYEGYRSLDLERKKPTAHEEPSSDWWRMDAAH
jgi:hypothetical protein